MYEIMRKILAEETANSTYIDKREVVKNYEQLPIIKADPDLETPPLRSQNL